MQPGHQLPAPLRRGGGFKHRGNGREGTRPAFLEFIEANQYHHRQTLLRCGFDEGSVWMWCDQPRNDHRVPKKVSACKLLGARPSASLPGQRRSQVRRDSEEGLAVSFIDGLVSRHENFGALSRRDDGLMAMSTQSGPTATA